MTKPMEYTKGEWYDTNYGSSNREYDIRTKKDGGLDAHIARVGGLTALKEAKTNARLIAQAPRLYEALKELLDGIDNGKEVIGYGREQKIRQAINAVEDK